MSQTVPSVKTLIFHNLRSDKSSDPIYWHKAYDLRYSRANDFPTSPREPISMYEKPVLQKYGTFRELTQLGMNGSTDGAAILGITSPGCSTSIGRWTFEVGCETGPGAS